MNNKKDPTRKRHHASKYYKKASGVTDHVIDTENPDHETMRQLASDWWNSWHKTTFIETLVNAYYYKPKVRRFDTLELLKGDEIETLKEKRECILKKEYYKLKKDIPQIHKMMNALTFNTIFMYCIPHFLKPWLDDVKADNRTIVSGELNNFILKTLHDSIESGKKVSKTWLYQNLEESVETFSSVFNGVITKLTNKEYIEPYKFCGSLHYRLTKSISYDAEREYFYEK